MKVLFSEGTIFLVPLTDGEFARGVAARVDPKGKILFGYFFGPRVDARAVSIKDLRADAALLSLRFGALGLRNGTWPVVGRLDNWNRTQWPMPDFIRRDPLGKRKPRLVHYSDNDPSHIESIHPIDIDPTLPTDSLSGYGAVELKLTKLLGGLEQP